MPLALALLKGFGVRPSVLEQRVNDLLRELNLLIYGADERELQNVLAALTATGALATARLREERRGRGVSSSSD